MPKLRTLAVHAGQGPDPATGALATPIYQTSTFIYGRFERGRRLFAGEEEGYLYTRIQNPTTRAFEEKLAALEGAEAAVAFTSGMAAISALVLTLLSPGDELVYLGPLYGGTAGFFHETLARYGVAVKDAGEAPLAAALSPRTRMVYVETPANPTLRIHDLAEVARVARAHGALSVADNTFATPALTRPLEHGIDLVVHSATKYLSGHGDVLGGAVAGPREIVEEIRAEGLRHLGGAQSPFDAYLLLRGMKTLPLRMAAHSEGAMAVARFLQGAEGVRRVFYPGLEDHPGHAVARRQMAAYGGMVAVDLGSEAAARAFLDALSYFAQGVSLGDADSLATHPYSTTHQLLPEEKRRAMGVTPGLVRLSVGLEDPEDLIEDLKAGLKAARAAGAPA